MNELELRAVAEIRRMAWFPPEITDDEIFSACRDTLYFQGRLLNMAFRDFMESILAPIRKVLLKLYNG